MADALLFNPHTYDPVHFDAETRRLLRATVALRNSSSY